MIDFILLILSIVGACLIFKAFLKWSNKHDQGYGLDDQYGNLF